MLKTLRFKPGVIKDRSELGAKPRWTDSQLIRFVQGQPEKLGGWQKTVEELFSGVCRGLIAWQDASNANRLAIGTHTKLQVMDGLSIFNVTPIRSSGTLAANPFETTSGSTTVIVEHTSHGAAAGDSVTYSGAAAVGGITIDGEYTIQGIIDGSFYIIEHTSTASSSATGGGASVTYQYEINVLLQDDAAGSGWGVGTYGSGTYGTARDTSIVLPAGIWTLDQWGQFIDACPRGGSIYQFENDVGVRAAVLPNAPTQNLGIFITEEQHLVALGAGGQKMRVQWSDQSDNTEWTPSDQTTAGSRNLVGGSELLFGLRTKGTNLIFSDAAAWTMTFIGGQDVFGFEQVAGGASGIIAPRAAVDVDGVVYWMGLNDFYMFDGVVRRIPNSKEIRRFVFDTLPAGNRSKIFCFANTLYSEIWFYYVGPGATEISRYIKVNTDDFSWDEGALVRTAAIDRSVFDRPIMASVGGQLYDHESGVNADGAAMESSIESSPFDISDGDVIAQVMSYIPDFSKLVGHVDVTLFTRYYPNSTKFEVDVGTVHSQTDKIDLRSSGRQSSIKFSSDRVDADWRVGVIRLNIEPGGNR